MTSSLALVVILLLLIGVLAWFLGMPRRRKTYRDDADEDLAEAEEEVRDLDAFLTPDEAEEELPDWGPGAPKS